MIRIASSRKASQVMALGLLLILLQPPVVSQAKTVDQVEDSSDLGGSPALSLLVKGPRWNLAPMHNRRILTAW